MRGFFARLAGRLRHGQAIQEILDRLARRGIVVYPYLVFAESADYRVLTSRGPKGIRTRRLTAEDGPRLATIANRWRSESGASKRLARGEIGIGAFDGDSLVAYTWCDLETLRGFGRNVVLRKLEPDEACIAKSWTRPDYRGRGIVLFLRGDVYAAMRALGRNRLSSVCLYFNRSVRRLKAKLGADALELRLAVNLLGQFKRDLTLRRYS